MIRFLKTLVSAAAGLAMTAAMGTAVFAEEFSIDIFEDMETKGSNQTYYTCIGNTDAPDNLDPRFMNEDSEVIVEYTYEGDVETGSDGYITSCPVALIWQSWGMDIGDKWVQVTPYEFDETSARYSFEDIAQAYGSDDFSTVCAINIANNGNATLTSGRITITNLRDPSASAEDAAAENAVVTTVDIAANAPQEGGNSSAVIAVIIVVVVVAAVAAAVVLIIKNNKSKNY